MLVQQTFLRWSSDSDYFLQTFQMVDTQRGGSGYKERLRGISVQSTSARSLILITSKCHPGGLWQIKSQKHEVR